MPTIHCARRSSGARTGCDRLDLAGEHRPGGDGALEKVARVGRVDPCPADLAHRVPGAADALRRRGQRAWRLHEQDLVEGADVDAELERAGGHQRRQFARLQPLFDRASQLARQRPVVRPGDLARRAVVDQPGDLLRQAAAVGEDERRAGLADALAEVVGDCRPQRVALSPLTRERGESGREPYADVVALRLTRFDDRDRAPHIARLVVGAALQPVASDPVGDALERPHRRRQRDALELPGEQHQAIDGGDEMRAALGRGDGVDLVEDHRSQAGEERRAGLRVDQQVEALRGGDQDLRALAHHLLAFAGGRVAAARSDPDARQLAAGGEEGAGDPGQRLRQVALDVGIQRLERRDVEHPRRPALPDPGRELLQRPEKCGQRLAAPGRGGEQDVPAFGDRSPGEPLDLRRRAEPLLEPAADPGIEALQAHAAKLSRRGCSKRESPNRRRRGRLPEVRSAAGSAPGRMLP